MPNLGNCLTWVRGSVRTPFGNIESHFSLRVEADGVLTHGSELRVRSDGGIGRFAVPTFGLRSDQLQVLCSDSVASRRCEPDRVDDSFAYFHSMPSGSHVVNVHYLSPVHRQFACDARASLPTRFRL